MVTLLFRVPKRTETEKKQPMTMCSERNASHAQMRANSCSKAGSTLLPFSLKVYCAILQFCLKVAFRLQYPLYNFKTN